MVVTINTDASFHPAHNIGTFSFWMTSNMGRMFGAGQLKGKIAHSTEAEFRSILNALHFLFNKTGWHGISMVIINTDSLNVVEMINGGKTETWAKGLKGHFNKYCRIAQVPVEARKVKAHSGTEDKRKWVNNWCDKQAKKLLRQTLKSKHK